MVVCALERRGEGREEKDRTSKLTSSSSSFLSFSPRILRPSRRLETRLCYLLLRRWSSLRTTSNLRKRSLRPVSSSSSFASRRTPLLPIHARLLLFSCCLVLARPLSKRRSRCIQDHPHRCHRSRSDRLRSEQTQEGRRRSEDQQGFHLGSVQLSVSRRFVSSFSVSPRVLLIFFGVRSQTHPPRFGC